MEQNPNAIPEGGYIPEIYVLTDEEGNDQNFELIDTIDYNGVAYFALVPYIDPDDENLMDEIEEMELVILKADGGPDSNTLVTIDDEEEYDTIGQIFLSRLNDEEEEEED